MHACPIYRSLTATRWAGMRKLPSRLLSLQLQLYVFTFVILSAAKNPRILLLLLL